MQRCVRVENGIFLHSDQEKRCRFPATQRCERLYSRFRKHKEAVDQRRGKGDAEGQLLFDKIFYPAYSSIALPFRAAETSRSPA